MKLLLEGLLMALVLTVEVVGLVTLAKYKASTEAYAPAQGSFPVVAFQGGGGGDYRWVEWDGSSCSVGRSRRRSRRRTILG